ncbi:GyrI-like domain-containing protein [Herbivorax sp. ANBcel31]|uniref:GyrI-like domain-containing protein n=1 Tax=Herbivorax sp. ANBcel31 TaxID=3069754 RepID=UPI0027B1F7FD|nr:GyrI-like domain-containing protein [Herbivorax sp. ANBcel31]MDQ2087811.1 GyrI-like domain-containing protein [Herbivorax sp. ANBcel31]
MNFKIEIEKTPTQPVLSIKKVTSVDNLPQECGRAYLMILERLKELGEEPADAPFAIYYNMDMENLQVELGFPVSKALPEKGDIKANEIPAGKKATCMHKGPYKDSEAVYNAMTKWIEENGYEPTGVVYEVYYNSPMDVPESELLTKIVFLLKD